MMAELNANPWGDAYRIVTGKLRGAQAGMSEQAQLEETKKLFPTRPKIRWPANPVPPVEPIDMEELSRAILRVKPGKAPGISAEMVRLIRSSQHQANAWRP